MVVIPAGSSGCRLWPPQCRSRSCTAARIFAVFSMALTAALPSGVDGAVAVRGVPGAPRTTTRSHSSPPSTGLMAQSVGSTTIAASAR